MALLSLIVTFLISSCLVDSCPAATFACACTKTSAVLLFPVAVAAMPSAPATFCSAATATSSVCDAIARISTATSTIAVAITVDGTFVDAESSPLTYQQRLVHADGTPRAAPNDVFVPLQVNALALHSLQPLELAPGASFALQLQACNAWAVCSPPLQSSSTLTVVVEAGIGAVAATFSATALTVTVTWSTARVGHIHRRV